MLRASLAVKIAVLAEPADRDFAPELIARLARQVVTVEIGHEPAGRDGIHANAFERELEAERLGQLHDAGFGRRIGDDALGDTEAEHRGDVYDGASRSGRQHAPRRLLGAEEHRIEVGAEDTPPFHFSVAQELYVTGPLQPTL